MSSRSKKGKSSQVPLFISKLLEMIEVLVLPLRTRTSRR